MFTLDEAYSLLEKNKKFEPKDFSITPQAPVQAQPQPAPAPVQQPAPQAKQYAFTPEGYMQKFNDNSKAYDEIKKDLEEMRKSKDMTNEDKMAYVLLAGLPALGGALLGGGLQGLAAGAQASKAGVDAFNTAQSDKQKEERDLALKAAEMRMKSIERGEDAHKTATTLQTQRENAAANRELKKESIGISKYKAMKEPKFNDSQFKSAGFAQRAEDAATQMEQLLKSGKFNPSGYAQELQASGFIPERLKDEGFKLQAQAERNFVNSILRQESGAAISESEFRNAEQQYFPRPGDTPEVLAQKERNRAVQIAALRAAAGGAMGKVQDQLSSSAKKMVTSKQYSPSRNQTRVIYSDGSIEVLDGKQ